jgi:polygalacturonase
MVSFTSALLAAFAASAVIATPVAVAGPAITPAPDAALAKRATSCTFSGANGAASASKSQKSCATMVLSGITVPSGTTLDLSDLADDTHASIFDVNLRFNRLRC